MFFSPSNAVKLPISKLTNASKQTEFCVHTHLDPITRMSDLSQKCCRPQEAIPLASLILSVLLSLRLSTKKSLTRLK